MKKKLISIIDCPICSSLKWEEAANLLNNESLPAASSELKRIPKDYPGQGMSQFPFCQLCNTFYHYECETGCFEHDLYLTRLIPEKVLSLGLIKKQEYNRQIKNLKTALNSSDKDMAAYAGKGLAEHYLATENKDRVIELLKHKNSNIRMHTCRSIHNCENPEPYIDILIAMLFDEDRFVKDTTLSVGRSYDNSTDKLLKYGKRLVRIISI